MKTFTVFWFYVGNHGAYIREAETPEDACRGVVRGFSEDFGKRAELIAVEGEHLMRPAKAYDPTLEVLGTQGCTFTLDDGRHGIVFSRQVTSLDERFIGRLDGDEPGTRRPITTQKVVEFIPADGPCCAAGGQTTSTRGGR
jgi:hypothetical protein